MLMRLSRLLRDRWAHQADPSAKLCSSESNVLSTLTLTKAEAYHNLVYRLKSQGIPIEAICVQASSHSSLRSRSQSLSGVEMMSDTYLHPLFVRLSDA